MTVTISAKPLVEVKTTAVRLQREENAGTAPTVLPVPVEARPVDLRTATCAYYKKRRELVVRWSRASVEPVVVLERFQTHFDEISKNVGVVDQKFANGELQPGRGMNELAQLEAQLEKLQCAGVDGVELPAAGAAEAHAAAKARRKDLTAQSELLHQRIDGLFNMMRQAKECTAAPASTMPTETASGTVLVTHERTEAVVAEFAEVASPMQDEEVLGDVTSQSAPDATDNIVAAYEEVLADVTSQSAPDATENIVAASGSTSVFSSPNTADTTADGACEVCVDVCAAGSVAESSRLDGAETVRAQPTEHARGTVTADDSSSAHTSREVCDSAPSEVSTDAASDESVTSNTFAPTAAGETIPEQPSKSADEWKVLGNAAVSAGDHAAAFENYSAGLQIDPHHAILLSNRALCLHKLGRLEEGLDDAKRCAQLRPDFAKSFIRGAMILRELGRPQEALELLRKGPVHEEVEKISAEVRPEAAAAEELRIASLCGAEQKKEQGNALYKKGLFEQALTMYDEALGMCSDPDGNLALSIRNNRAGCFHQLSDFAQVIKDTSFVLEREPGNLKALIRRMLACEPLEKYEAALDDARKVLYQCPSNEQANKVQHRLGKLVREMQRD
jgi:tetratricopeptide (TPR) repeat protein